MIFIGTDDEMSVPKDSKGNGIFLGQTSNAPESPASKEISQPDPNPLTDEAVTSSTVGDTRISSVTVDGQNSSPSVIFEGRDTTPSVTDGQNTPFISHVENKTSGGRSLSVADGNVAGSASGYSASEESNSEDSRLRDSCYYMSVRNRDDFAVKMWQILETWPLVTERQRGRPNAVIVGKPSREEYDRCASLVNRRTTTYYPTDKHQFLELENPRKLRERIRRDKMKCACKDMTDSYRCQDCLEANEQFLTLQTIMPTIIDAKETAHSIIGIPRAMHEWGNALLALGTNNVRISFSRRDRRFVVISRKRADWDCAISDNDTSGNCSFGDSDDSERHVVRNSFPTPSSVEDGRQSRIHSIERAASLFERTAGVAVAAVVLAPSGRSSKDMKPVRISGRGRSSKCTKHRSASTHTTRASLDTPAISHASVISHTIPSASQADSMSVTICQPFQSEPLDLTCSSYTAQAPRVSSTTFTSASVSTAVQGMPFPSFNCSYYLPQEPSMFCGAPMSGQTYSSALSPSVIPSVHTGPFSAHSLNVAGIGASMGFFAPGYMPVFPCFPPYATDPLYDPFMAYLAATQQSATPCMLRYQAPALSCHLPIASTDSKPRDTRHAPQTAAEPAVASTVSAMKFDCTDCARQSTTLRRPSTPLIDTPLPTSESSGPFVTSEINDVQHLSAVHQPSTDLSEMSRQSAATGSDGECSLSRRNSADAGTAAMQSTRESTWFKHLEQGLTKIINGKGAESNPASQSSTASEVKESERGSKTCGRCSTAESTTTVFCQPLQAAAVDRCHEVRNEWVLVSTEPRHCLPSNSKFNFRVMRNEAMKDDTGVFINLKKSKPQTQTFPPAVASPSALATTFNITSAEGVSLPINSNFDYAALESLLAKLRLHCSNDDKMPPSTSSSPSSTSPTNTITASNRPHFPLLRTMETLERFPFRRRMKPSLLVSPRLETLSEFPSPVAEADIQPLSCQLDSDPAISLFTLPAVTEPTSANALCSSTLPLTQTVSTSKVTVPSSYVTQPMPEKVSRFTVTPNISATIMNTSTSCTAPRSTVTTVSSVVDTNITPPSTRSASLVTPVTITASRDIIVSRAKSRLVLTPVASNTTKNEKATSLELPSDKSPGSTETSSQNRKSENLAADEQPTPSSQCGKLLSASVPECIQSTDPVLGEQINMEKYRFSVTAIESKTRSAGPQSHRETGLAENAVTDEEELGATSSQMSTPQNTSLHCSTLHTLHNPVIKMFSSPPFGSDVLRLPTVSDFGPRPLCGDETTIVTVSSVCSSATSLTSLVTASLLSPLTGLSRQTKAHTSCSRTVSLHTGCTRSLTCAKVSERPLCSSTSYTRPSSSPRSFGRLPTSDQASTLPLAFSKSPLSSLSLASTAKQTPHAGSLQLQQWSTISVSQLSRTIQQSTEFQSASSLSASSASLSVSSLPLPFTSSTSSTLVSSVLTTLSSSSSPSLVSMAMSQSTSSLLSVPTTSSSLPLYSVSTTSSLSLSSVSATSSSCESSSSNTPSS